MGLKMQVRRVSGFGPEEVYTGSMSSTHGDVGILRLSGVLGLWRGA